MDTSVGVRNQVDQRDGQGHQAKRVRRFHSDQAKADIVAQCGLPGASVAAIARSHGINANIVHGWCKDPRFNQGGKRHGEFVALPLNRSLGTDPVPQADQAAPTIHIEVLRGSAKVLVQWPTSAAPECVTLLRDLLLGVCR